MKTNLRGIAAQQKYLQFMNELYAQKNFNRRIMEGKYKISHSICTELAKRGYIVIDKKDQWRWIGQEPSVSLAIDVLKGIRVQNKYRTQSKKTTTTQLSIKPIRKAPAPTSMLPVDEIDFNTSNSKMFLILAVGAIVGFIIATIIWK
jgi:hypothetical protein